MTNPERIRWTAAVLMCLGATGMILAALMGYLSMRISEWGYVILDVVLFVANALIVRWNWQIRRRWQ